MVDYANPLRPNERLADRDRAQAIVALTQARDEGRLTPEEFDQRSASAKSAVVWGDLSPLFTDLPRASVDHHDHDDRYRDRYYYGRDRDRGSRALGGAWGATIMSLVPFLALGLFFIAGFVWDGWAWGWLFFLMIPIAGAIIYGPGAQYRNRR
ncbi:MAG: DUF1707 SHOCT-like domain-containing protein [Humibacter sp.]